MNIIYSLLKIFRKLLDSFLIRHDDFQVPIGDDDERGIINPEEESISYQLISPRDYEFTEKEKLSVLRPYDYIYLPYAQEQLGEEG